MENTYQRHDWAHGEVISEQLLDNIENGIEYLMENKHDAADFADVDDDHPIGEGNLIATERTLLSKADKTDTVLNTTFSRGRNASTIVGTGSFAFGEEVEASGQYSHAEGMYSIASGRGSHAESVGQATSFYAHAESAGIAAGNRSHAENNGYAKGEYSHAEGSGQAMGDYSHAEGYSTLAWGQGSHASGQYNTVDTYSSWPEWTSGTSYIIGDKVKVTVDNSKPAYPPGTLGYICTTANSDLTFNTNNWELDARLNYVEMIGNGKANNASNARTLDWNGNERLMGNLYVGCNADSTGGTKVIAVPMTGATSLAAGASGLVPAPSTGDNIKFLRGDGTWQDVTVGGAAIASLIFNGVEYQPTNGTVIIDGGRAANTTVGSESFAFGHNVEASGSYSHAEGRSTTASGNSSHAEGASSAARGMIAHAEGNSCFADGNGAHAEGSHTQAYQQYSHSEGEYTYAAGRASHVSGRYNVLDGSYPEWVSGTSYVIDDKVTFGEDKFVCTAPNSDTTFDSSKWQEDKYLNFAEIVGMGAADDLRCNARALDWNGNERLKGTLYTKCNDDSTGGYQVYDTSMIVYSTDPNGPANPVEGMIWLKPE